MRLLMVTSCLPGTHGIKPQTDGRPSIDPTSHSTASVRATRSVCMDCFTDVVQVSLSAKAARHSNEELNQHNVEKKRQNDKGNKGEG